MTEAKAVCLKIAIVAAPGIAYAFYADWKLTAAMIGVVTVVTIWVWLVDKWVEWLRS